MDIYVYVSLYVCVDMRAHARVYVRILLSKYNCTVYFHTIVCLNIFLTRVVNVSSRVSTSALNASSAELSGRLKSISSIEELTCYMRKFIE